MTNKGHSWNIMSIFKDQKSLINSFNIENLIFDQFISRSMLYIVELVSVSTFQKYTHIWKIDVTLYECPFVRHEARASGVIN